MATSESELSIALNQGDPDLVRALVAAGHDLRYEREHGYNAMLDAVHGRDVARDPRLLDLLALLIAKGVDLNRVSSYSESALRVLSHIGRFDAVGLLLSKGADKSQLKWTPLIEAVALGSLAEVERHVRSGAALEETDWWKRTAWLVALLAGGVSKAKVLRELGANINARGGCGQPPLHYGIEGHHPEIVRWLLALGQDVEQTDEFGTTPLMAAVKEGDPECVDLLLAAGADVGAENKIGRVLRRAETKEMVQRLLDVGADPRHLSQEGHRALCGLGPLAHEIATVADDEFRRAHTRRFGAANPELLQEPFWEAMIRAGAGGFEGGRKFDADPTKTGPTWSAQRFGQSTTPLPDGRVIQIAGEHEDHYDPDFCIYNDVFVHDGRCGISVYGYPEATFPSTDFHTATLIDDAIYVIGSLGYAGTRRYGHTPVFRLDVGTFRMDRLRTTGDAPGWIYEHRAVGTSPGEIRVTGGTVVTAGPVHEAHELNTEEFVLDVKSLVWRRRRRGA